MSEYLDKIGIKSIVGLNKWFQNELKNAASIECVKIDSGVVVFWASENILHRHLMKCPTIYTLQEQDLKNAINEIKTTLNK